jgi:hypothetical protein
MLSFSLARSFKIVGWCRSSCHHRGAAHFNQEQNLRIFLVSALLLLSLCSPPQMRVLNEYDDFGRLRRDRMVGNRVELNVDVNMERLTHAGKSLYLVGIHYRGHEWLFIDPAEPLRLLLDGSLREAGLFGGKISRDVLSGSHVIEKAYYRASQELVEEIKAAGSVKLRVVGQLGVREVELLPENLENIRKFLEDYPEIS